MIKNSGELIVLAQLLVFIHNLIHWLVEFGGGKYRSTSDISGLSGIIQW